MNLPKFNTYCEYSSKNYGAHCLCVQVGPVTVWFSYQTPVAFQVGCLPRVVHQNDWGTTTGKHLNAIDGGNKQGRVSAEVFQQKWNAAFAAEEPVLREVGAVHSGGVS